MKSRWMGLAAPALLCLAAAAGAQPGTCTLTVHVDGFRNQRAFFHKGFPIAGTESSAQVSLPPGRYALVVLHDENSNHKLDRNFLGIPKEGFGFANNPRVMLIAPGFDTAAFEVACPATDLRIHLIYK